MMTIHHRIPCLCAALAVFACPSHSQQTVTGSSVQPGILERSTQTITAEQGESKRLLGLIPNYRTAPTIQNFEPLTTREKFKIATEDALDRGTFVLAALFAGESQLTNANRSFGQGTTGFGKYFGASLADLEIGNYMTEAIYPSVLHQDPRYFRQGTGTRWSRLRYAAGQILVTHGDGGKKEINYSELFGNATAVAISQSYYSDKRTASDAVSKFVTQLGIDAGANILKEFWPDLQRKLTRKRR
jgi:hypothetical protein